MSLPQTKAAQYIQLHAESLTSHQIISLLLDGALERIEHTQLALNNSDIDDAQALKIKFLGIVEGLQGYLDVERGGDIAVNLFALYSYIIKLIQQSTIEKLAAGMDEARVLLSEVKSGWDEMNIQQQKVAV